MCETIDALPCSFCVCCVSVTKFIACVRIYSTVCLNQCSPVVIRELLLSSRFEEDITCGRLWVVWCAHFGRQKYRGRGLLGCIAIRCA